MATEPKKTKQQAYNDAVVDSIKFLITQSDQSWRKEWASDGYRQQGYKGNEYKNTNQLILFKKAVQEKYIDPRWMTFNQIVENGYKLEKGSKASTVMFYTNTRKELVRDENGKPKLDSNGEKTYKTHLLDRPVAVSYNVFNATKINGIEPFSLNQSQNQNTQPLMSAADIIKLDEGTRNRNDSVDLNNLSPAESRSLRNELENDIKQVEEERKISQLEIIKQYNPMSDDIHTGIRDISDIKSFEEIGEDFTGTPDFTEQDYNQALESGNITVYSSKPIEQGIFVTPSRMEAESYAGNGEVYSKDITLSQVAWIDSMEGQFADVHQYKSQNIASNPDIDLLNEKFSLPPNWNGQHYLASNGDDIHIGLNIDPVSVREITGDNSTHRPENNGINPSNMTGVFPEDFYRNPDYYHDMDEKPSKESFNVLKKIRDNPDAEVTIYRADNANYLINADWVSLSKAYAEEHADNMRETLPDVRVTAYQAKASDLNINGDSINELGLFVDDARLKEINSTANEVQEPRAVYDHPDAEIYNDIDGHFSEARKIYDKINVNIDDDLARLKSLIPNESSMNQLKETLSTDFGDNSTPYYVDLENSEEIRISRDFLYKNNEDEPAQVNIDLYPLSNNEAREIAEILNSYQPELLLEGINNTNDNNVQNEQRISDTAFTLAEIGDNATQRGTAARFTIDNLPTDFDHFVMRGDENRSSIHAVGQSGEASKVLTGLNDFQTKEVYTQLADINPADIREFARHQEGFKRDDVMTPAQFAEFAQERKHEAINEVKERYPSLDLDAIRAIQDQDNVRFSHSEAGELFAHSDNGDHSLALTGVPLVDWKKGEAILSEAILSDLHANNELGALIEAYQPLTGEYLERERPLSAYVETKNGITIEAEPATFEAIKAIPDNWGGEVAQMGDRTLINLIDENGKMDFTEFKPDLNGIDFDRLNELLKELDADEVKDLKTKISEKEELAQEQRKPEEYQPVGLDLVEQRLLHNLYQWLKSDDGYEIQRQTGETPETVGTVATEAEAIDITDWLNNFNGLPQPEKNEAIAQLEQLREQSLALGFNGGDNGLNTGDNPNAPQLPDYSKIDQDIAAYVESNGLRLQEMSSEGAFFQNGTDSKIVVVPLKEQFGDNQDAYYATLFHELTHSTKVLENSRQGFETDNARGNNFGSQNYAREELVAEVGSLLLCQHYGINSFVDPDNEKISDLTQNSAAYLKNWIEAGSLKDNDIVMAVSEAKRSTNIITGHNKEIAKKIENAEKLETKQNEGMKV